MMEVRLFVESLKPHRKHAPGIAPILACCSLVREVIQGSLLPQQSTKQECAEFWELGGICFSDFLICVCVCERESVCVLSHMSQQG